MRFLLDENLSPRLAGFLSAAGHDVLHLRDIGLSRASDEVVIARARTDDRVLVSADTDFGTLLARDGSASPSFLLMRRASGRRASEQAHLILDNLIAIEGDLMAGAIVVLGESTVRIRKLPIGGL
jgi:predicted nuclease of predicted toxin-antitoxin system